MNEKKWVVRPLHITIYNIIKSIAGKKKYQKRDEMVTYDELVQELRERGINADEDEILKNIMKLELWSVLDVYNNGATLEIRLRGELSGR